VSDDETEYTIRFFFLIFTESDSEIRVGDAETEHGTRFGYFLLVFNISLAKPGEDATTAEISPSWRCMRGPYL